MPAAEKSKSFEKVIQLERAVLWGDEKQVQKVYEKEESFEFTARAVAYAMRFRGVDMVRTLLDLGATLSYSDTGRLDTNYDTYFGSCWGRQKDFVKYLFPQAPLQSSLLFAYDSRAWPDVLDAQSRLDVARYLADRRIPQLHMMYYYALLLDSMNIADMLETKNITRLPSPISDIITGRVAASNIQILGLEEYVEELHARLKEHSHKTLAQVLTRFAKAITGKIDVSGCNKDDVDVMCSADLFPVFVQYSNLLDTEKRSLVFDALVAEGNTAGFQYFLSQKENLAPDALAGLLEKAQHLPDSDHLTDVIGEALQARIGNVAGPNAVSLTRADARKNWLFEVHGTTGGKSPSVEILTYIGDSEDVTVPAYIGGLPVTHMSRETFIPPAGKENDGRANPITRLVIPGTVRKLSQLFGVERDPKVVLRIGRFDDRAPQQLKTLILEEGVEEISAGCFENCKELENVSLPQSLRIIGKSSFAATEALTHIDLPEGLKTIEPRAFEWSGLTEIEIPATVTRIGEEAFAGCWELAGVKVPSSTNLGAASFGRCPDLADSQGRIVVNNTLAGYYGVKHIDQHPGIITIPASLEIPSSIVSVPQPYEEYPAILYRPSDAPSETVDPRRIRAGQIVRFGRFPLDTSLELKPIEWRVLAVHGDKALLLTEHLILAWRMAPGTYTLRKTGLAEFLNDVFLPVAYSAQEQAQITAQADPRTHKTDEGVFLLTYNQICSYLPRAKKDREASPTPYACAQLKRTAEPFTSDRNSKNNYLLPAAWLIRPDGGNARNINVLGKPDKLERMTTYLRPAIWIGRPAK